MVLFCNPKSGSMLANFEAQSQNHDHATNGLMSIMFEGSWSHGGSKIKSGGFRVMGEKENKRKMLSRKNRWSY